MGLMDLFKRRGAPEGADDARVAELVRRLADPDPKVRLAACTELGLLGKRARAAVPALEERIGDADGDVCNAAAGALSRIER